MNTMTLDAKKNFLIRQILDTDSSELLNKVEQLFRRETKKAAKTTEDDDYMTKEEILAGFSEACKEIKLAREGKLKGTPLKEFLDEL